AIDFVGQQDVGEHRSLANPEGPRLKVVDRGADDVGRHEVGRELHPAVLQRKETGNGFGEQGFAHSRHSFEEDVALRDQGQGAEANRLVLTDDRLRRLGTKTRVKVGSLHADSFWFSTIDNGWARSCSRRAMSSTAPSEVTA